MYKLIKNQLTQQINYVLKDGMLNIPFDPDNRDYQQYLKWLEEGNTPLPADEQGAE
jgi:hypothetical protein